MTEWNDDRLDELNERVKDGFAQVDERFVRLEGEIKERFDKGDERFSTREEMSELRADLRQLVQRFDRLYYLILVTMVGLAGSLLANNFWS